MFFSDDERKQIAGNGGHVVLGRAMNVTFSRNTVGVYTEKVTESPIIYMTTEFSECSPPEATQHNIVFLNNTFKTDLIHQLELTSTLFYLGHDYLPNVTIHFESNLFNHTYSTRALPLL